MRLNIVLLALASVLLLSGCADTVPSTSTVAPLPQAAASNSEAAADQGAQNGIVTNQILESGEGQIHYSYFLPTGYGSSQSYPMMVVMPGYDRIWHGESTAGSNLDWSGFTVWTELDEEMIVVSAQLTGWDETSARQANALTEYFIENFAVDTSRIYAAGYSAGGETMSQAVALRPDLYTAYLHGASQWDGTYAPLAENRVAVYIYMAEGDEYYGVQKAHDAYESLHDAYAAAGMSEEEIDAILKLETPSDEYFAQLGMIGNYHGAANIVFDDAEVINWIISKSKYRGAELSP